MTSQALRSLEPAPTPASIARPEPTSRARSRRTASRPFKGFDDDFDGSVNLNSIPEAMAVDEAPVVEPQSQGLFVSQDPEPNFESEPSQSIVQTQTRASRASRKRPAPPVETEEEFMEQMAPATTKLKRQRLADEAARRRRGESTPPPPPAPKQQVAPVITTSKKVKQETDILGVARERREKADELAKAEREALERDLEGMDIEAIRNLAIVEEFEIKRAAPPPRAAARADESDRWEDKWNGRKNFKKFRRRGADGENRRGLNRVIVPLEEVKKKDFGIGDDYWLEDDKDSQRKNKKKGKEKETQDTSQSQSGRPRPKSRAAERAAEILASEVEKDLIRAEDERVASSPDVEIVEKPTKPVASTRSQRSQPHSLVDKPSTSRNLSPQKKRPAAATLTKPAPPKKARQTLIRKEESDDSDDDGLRFKFKKK
jgi:nijmegen breakage syndrome protein 1